MCVPFTSRVYPRPVMTNLLRLKGHGFLVTVKDDKQVLSEYYPQHSELYAVFLFEFSL